MDTLDTLDQFITAHRKANFKPTSEMLERWNGRIIPQRLTDLGAAGAAIYMGNHPATGLDKLLRLAQTCHYFGFPDLARGFWTVAYEKQYGCPPPVEPAAPPTLPAADCPAYIPTDGLADGGEEYSQAELDLLNAEATAQDAANFPDHLQPGCLATMQPVDTDLPPEHFICHRAYVGQPKRDGHRCVVFATPDQVLTQARSYRMGTLPIQELAAALRIVAREQGSFILDGELWWADAGTPPGEHRTGAQAATANAHLGRPDGPVTPVYSIFECLYWQGQDLTEQAMYKRFRAADAAFAALQPNLPTSWAGRSPVCEYLGRADTEDEKRQLFQTQKRTGREGVIWRDRYTSYRGGKQSASGILRQKFPTERVVKVTGFTPKTATKDPTRLFGALCVADPETGRPLGNVGTGFTQAEQRELLTAFEGGDLFVEVQSQGVTEGGTLWLPRFRGIVTA